jgi:hypothetical protein
MMGVIFNFDYYNLEIYLYFLLLWDSCCAA